MTLGEIIRNYRNAHGQTLIDFSEKSGLSKSYISILESGKSPHGNVINPSVDTISKIAIAMNTSFDSIYKQLDIIQKQSIQNTFEQHIGTMPLELAQMYAVLDDAIKEEIHKEIEEKYKEFQKELREYERIEKLSEITSLQDAKLFMKKSGILDENADEKDIIHDANIILKYKKCQGNPIFA